MICPVCLKPSSPETITDADYAGYGARVVVGLPPPKYATHKRCDYTGPISVCAGHCTPPGLEEIEERMH